MKFFLVLLLLVSVALAQTNPKVQKVVQAAISQVGVTVMYDPAYSKLAFPMGDVPLERGVCTDVVIRAFRAVGIDFQALVHQDMTTKFRAYPRLWGLTRPDSNIDHRRVANLEVFLTRRGKAIKLSKNGRDYRAGEIISWTLPNGRLHIGVVTEKFEPSGQRPLIVHNIGSGAQLEDVLFAWDLRYRYYYF